MFYGFKLGKLQLVEFFLAGKSGYHDAFTFLSLPQVLPNLFGDKRHEGMEVLQQVFEDADGLFIGFPVDGLPVCRLDDFQQPRGEFVTEGGVDGHQGFGNAVLRKLGIQGFAGFFEQVGEPFQCLIWLRHLDS